MQKSNWKGPFLVVILLLSEITCLGATDTSKRSFKSSREIRLLRQLDLAKSLRSLRLQIEALAQISAEGSSYVSIIPYVTSENNSRTNLGLNNYGQSSLLRGTNPSAKVLIGLMDPQGNVANRPGLGSYVVRSNELLQINDIIAALGGNIGTGWLLIFSDEPLTAWASVILNSTSDPSIELAIADQIFKPHAFVESQGTVDNPLLIQSSVKSGSFQSSLVVVNIGSGDGSLMIKLYNNGGQQISTKSASIKANGMFIDNDIRSVANETFGPIVIEVSDPTPTDDKSPRVVANSVVKSTNGTGAFFPAFALPQPNTISVAGVWEGSLTGTIINAQARVELYQERDMLYGTLKIVSGNFPTAAKNFLISGEVIENKYLLHVQDAFDADADLTFFSYRLFGNSLTGMRLEGDTIYFDEQDLRDIGGFSLTRTGSID
jgi:hypothetical protein